MYVRTYSIYTYIQVTPDVPNTEVGKEEKKVDKQTVPTRAMALMSLNSFWGKINSFQQDSVLLSAAADIGIAMMKGTTVGEKEAASVAFSTALRLRNNQNFIAKYFGLLGTKYDKVSKRIRMETATQFIKKKELESLLECELKRRAR